MQQDDKLFASVGSLAPTVRTASFARDRASPGQASFAEALNQARPVGDLREGASRTVAPGDTLSSIVREHAAARGVALSASQIMQQAQRVALDNGISNSNRIFPGQKIALAGLNQQLSGLAPGGTPPQALTVAALQLQQAGPLAATSPDAAARAGAGVGVGVGLKEGGYPVLRQTLTRAVEKGFIPAPEKADVYDKILQLAAKHRFNPDDFARVTLMESDGMNPRATNQRCHGIIQFCDGSDRGAASAGYSANPKAILGLSVYQQLHLVDNYLGDVGLKKKGPVGLDDLYLSVLMPSARSDTQPDSPLNIAGSQATYLHVDRDTSAPITRQSILQGLQQNAADRLGQRSPSGRRLQAMRLADYEEKPLSGNRLR